MQKFTFKIRILITCLLLAVVILNTSCVDLEAIRKFAENSAVVQQKFPALSADFYGSCVREYRYDFYQQVNFAPALMLEVDKISGKPDFTGFKTKIPALNTGKTIVQRENECRRFKEHHEAALLLNKVLVDYMTALSELAADDLTNYDESLDALGTSITQAGIFEERHINAGSSLAKFISSATAGFWRRKKLKSAIQERDADVAVVARVLQLYVQRDYVERLEQEQLAVDEFYKRTISEYQRNNPNVNQLTVLAAKDTWDTKRKELQDKLDAAEAYGKILKNVIAGHRELYNSSENLDAEATRQLTMQYAKNIAGLIETFSKAF